MKRQVKAFLNYSQMQLTGDEISTERILLGFRQALAKFIERDSYLLEHDVYERAITHKLAEYLQEVFVNWNVDCEYNRDGNEPKRVGLPDVSQESTRRNIYPDIIIHQRGTNDYNLLIVEAKKSNDARLGGEDHDRNKLVAYARDLGYRVGIFIVFSIRNPGVKRHKYESYYEGVWHAGSDES
jgi:hypothetical protein